MTFQTRLTQKLKIKYPIIQAPMGGGASTIDMAAATSNAGGLGFIAAAYLKPEEIVAAGRELREKTDQPFGINLFAPVQTQPLPDNYGDSLDLLEKFYHELNLTVPALPDVYDTFTAKLAAALETGAGVFSFTFGIPPASAIEVIKNKGMLAVGTATTPMEGKLLENVGFDAIVAQGAEAGGHRGTFATGFENALIGTIALVPQLVDSVSIPVIASGGIMDGRGIAAALMLGADAVQMGTAFLTCAESGIADVHQQAILASTGDDTRVTRAFSGRPARGISNRFMDELDENPAKILPYPYQNVLTRTMRKTAASQGAGDYLSLWAGQGAALARQQTTAELITRLVADMDGAFERLSRSRHDG